VRQDAIHASQLYHRRFSPNHKEFAKLITLLRSTLVKKEEPEDDKTDLANWEEYSVKKEEPIKSEG
jgi:hypothetical protein